MMRTESTPSHRPGRLPGQEFRGRADVAIESDETPRVMEPARVYEQVNLLTDEAVKGCHQLAQWMECRGEESVARLFRCLLDREAGLAADRSYRLPPLARNATEADIEGYGWLYDRPVEAGADGFLSHLMTGWNAINIALSAKGKAKRLLEEIAQSTEDPRARVVLLMRMREEGEQIGLLATALERTPRPLVSEEDWEGVLNLDRVPA